MKVPAGLCHECLEKTEPGSRFCQRHKGKPKYRNKKIAALIDGQQVVFDSGKEERQFAALCAFQKAGYISLLSRQPRFRLVVNGVHVCTYVGDFQYYHHARGRMVVEDAKGMRTRAYRIKAKLFKAVTGYEIKEV